MKVPVVFVHNMDGRPFTIRVGRDRIITTKSGVVVVKNGERIKVRESKKEIDGFIRELD